MYAPKRSGSEAPIHEFTMIFVRDGVDEHHDFEARPSLGWADVKGLVPLLGGTKDDDLIRRALGPIDRLIRRCLRNDDGTPERWEPRTVEPDGEDGKVWFTAPNGDHTDADLLPTFTTFSAGSSRRRWVHLMERDDDLTVEPEQVMALMQDLMGVATGGRPTKRSADSSDS